MNNFLQVAFVFKNTQTNEQWESPLVFRAALASTYFESMLHFYNNEKVVIEFADVEELGYHPMQAMRVLHELNDKLVRSVPVPLSLQSFFSLEKTGIEFTNPAIQRKVLRNFLLRRACRKIQKGRYMFSVQVGVLHYACEVKGLLVRCAWFNYDNPNLEEYPSLIHDNNVVVPKWDGSFMTGCYPSLRGSLSLCFDGAPAHRYVVYYFYQPRYLRKCTMLYQDNGITMHFRPNKAVHSVLMIRKGYVCRMVEGDECHALKCVCFHYKADDKLMFSLQFLRKNGFIY